MSEDVFAQPGPGSGDDEVQTLAKYRAFGNAVLDVGGAPQETVEDWLGHVVPSVRTWVDVAMSLRTEVAPPAGSMTLGCWAAIFEPRTALTWACVASAMTGYTTTAVRTRYRQHLQAACPGERLPNWNDRAPDSDEFCRGWLGQAPSQHASAPASNGTNHAGQHAGGPSALDTLRNTLGLGASVRLARTIAGPSHPWTLIVQIDAPPGAQLDSWDEATCITALAALAPFLQRGFDMSIGRRLAHQHSMTRHLTPIQSELLPLLIDGMKEQEISQTLKRNSHSVHDAVKGIYRNLGVRSRVELIRRWHQLDA
jgi:DNA-binding CsgD family transcriptional regulator